MMSMLISFGHAASHSPKFVQSPKPSASICVDHRSARAGRAPAGPAAAGRGARSSRRRRASPTRSGTRRRTRRSRCRPRRPSRVRRRPSGPGSRWRPARCPCRREMKPPACDDAVERAAVDDEILDDRERRARATARSRSSSPSLKLRMCSWQVAVAAHRPVRHAVDHQPHDAADAFAAVVVERDRLLALARSSRSLTTSSISRNDMSGLTSRRLVVDEAARRRRGPVCRQTCSVRFIDRHL